MDCRNASSTTGSAPQAPTCAPRWPTSPLRHACWRRARTLGPWLLGLLTLVAPPKPTAAASFPPELRFRTLASARVDVHFPDVHEAQARLAAALADEILTRHEARYGVHVGRVQVVLTDTEDEPNGFASPLPYPLVHVRLAAPRGQDSLGNYDTWLRLVLTHELAHVVHLDQAHGLQGVGRKLFGRAPFLFPNLLTPLWMIEGLATYEETEGTAFGRGRDAEARMLRRMAALAGRFPGEDQPVRALDAWPAGQAAYVFGEAFLRDLAEQHGPRTLPELARVHAGRPVPYLDELTAKRVTGASFHARWREWTARERQRFEGEAAARALEAPTLSHALTNRGVRQYGARFSPDGRWIAYTSATLTRYPAIHVMRSDGSADRRLVERSGGDTLAFTPDGRTLVYHEPQVQRLFTQRNGLRAVDVHSGRARWILRGVRASDPDVTPDGRGIVFVRRTGDRSELAWVGLDGRGLRDLTTSAPETEWSGPRVNARGDALVAARHLPGGWLDIVLVELATGQMRALTTDRAKDVEPSFTPDGRSVVFRSDRDGISNIYVLDVDARTPQADSTATTLPRRLTRVLGGAFAPALGPDGRTLVFADYSAKGYDIRSAELDLAAAPIAPPYEDAGPVSATTPALATGATHPYRPLRQLLPHFWSPVAAHESGEWRAGVATGGLDPLFRHAYGLVLFRGFDSRHVGLRGFYQYDRWWPTLLAVYQDETDPPNTTVGRLHTREWTLRATLPLRRSFQRTHSAELTWRLVRGTLLDREDLRVRGQGGLELAWVYGSAKRYPFAISPSDGMGLRVAWYRQAPALGGELSYSKLGADLRGYLRLGASQVLALRVGAGATLGQPDLRDTFAIGGFPDGALSDLLFTNPAVLRGYPDAVARGRSLAYGSAEYRLPLAHPQRGWGSAPFFLRHLHAAAFVDGAHVWDERFRVGDVRCGVGLALGADTSLGHALPLSASLGLAHGLTRDGDTRAYLRLGLAF